MSSPARRKPSSHETPPVDPDQVCQAHLGLRNQPGDDGRRLPWNTNNNMSTSICTDGGPCEDECGVGGYRQGNFLWHIDGATDVLPQRATSLTAREIDEAGGDTEFATTYAAFNALPESDKSLLEGLRVVHSFAAAQLRSNPGATDDEQAVWDRVPSRNHPLVWTRRDGRKSLLLGGNGPAGRWAATGRRRRLT